MEDCKISSVISTSIDSQEVIHTFNKQSNNNYIPIGHPSRPSAFKRTNGTINSNLNCGVLSYSELGSRMQLHSHQPINLTFCFFTNAASNIAEEEKSAMKVTPKFGPSMIPSKKIQQKDCNNFCPESVRKLADSSKNDINEQLKSIFGPDHCDNMSDVNDTTMTDCTPSRVIEFGGADTDHKIGRYTAKERQEKIRRYKLKIQKWKLGLNANKDRYIKRRVIAKNKPRVGGKFVKTGSNV